MPGTFTALHYHLVFSTKDRFPMIHGDLEPWLHEFMGGIVRSLNSILLEAGGMPDHVHLLTRVPPKHALSDFMRALKSKSSGWVHENLPAASKFALQEGYRGFAVSKSDVPKVAKYIRNQSEHHRKLIFKEELQRFLEVHEIPFEEEYLW